MPLWIGRPGSLKSIRSPLRGADVEMDLGTAQLDALRGGRTIDMMGAGLRTWRFSWPSLTTASAGVLRGLALGSFGPGPYVMYDPSQRNYLAANQSSGTDVLALATGFTPQASQGTVTSSLLAAFTGVRSLRWLLPASPGANPYVELDWPGGSFGYPVIPSTAYTFSGQISGDAATLVVRLDLVWTDATGATLSTSSGTGAAVNGAVGTFAVRSVTATSPANAVYARPRITVTTATANKIVHADTLQLELGSAVSTHEPGLGLPLVAFQGLPGTYPWSRIHSLEAMIAEVA